MKIVQILAQIIILGSIFMVPPLSSRELMHADKHIVLVQGAGSNRCAELAGAPPRIQKIVVSADLAALRQVFYSWDDELLGTRANWNMMVDAFYSITDCIVDSIIMRPNAELLEFSGLYVLRGRSCNRRDEFKDQYSEFDTVAQNAFTSAELIESHAIFSFDLNYAYVWNERIPINNNKHFVNFNFADGESHEGWLLEILLKNGSVEKYFLYEIDGEKFLFSHGKDGSGSVFQRCSGPL